MKRSVIRILKSLRSLLLHWFPQSIIRIWQSQRTFSRSQQSFLFLLLLLLLGLLYFRFYHRPLSALPEINGKETVVELKGGIRNPGVHLFGPPPTLKEAIERAGGLKEGYLPESARCSERLETGTLVAVENEPEEIRIRLERMESHKLLVFSIPLNLNGVSAEDLCLIPGIGESLAREMIAHRERRRGFHSVEELRNVKGIGEKKWRELKGFFVVDSSNPIP
jgi:competence protein ComEA